MRVMCETEMKWLVCGQQNVSSEIDDVCVCRHEKLPHCNAKTFEKSPGNERDACSHSVLYQQANVMGWNYILSLRSAINLSVSHRLQMTTPFTSPQLMNPSSGSNKRQHLYSSHSLHTSPQPLLCVRAGMQNRASFICIHLYRSNWSVTFF